MEDRSTTARFWSCVEVDPNSGCWLWSGKLHHTGYGYLRVGGRKSCGAHRFSYEEHIGSIGPGMFVCHKCDVRSCVNPGHLFLGTLADNHADMVAKGRQAGPRDARGEKNRNAKITVAQAEEIRTLRGLERQVDIAARYGISQVMVSKIQRGSNWTNVA